MSRTTLRFYDRFSPDILSGAKTLTLRDGSASDIVVGDVLAAVGLPSQRTFATLRITEVGAIAFDDLNEGHAQQENMSLTELRAVIRDIYPGVKALHAITFSLLASFSE